MAHARFWLVLLGAAALTLAPALAQDNPVPGYGTAGGSNARTYVYNAPYVFGDGSWTNMVAWTQDVQAVYGTGRNTWANITFDQNGDLYYVGYTGSFANSGKLIKASGATGAFLWASALQVNPGGDSLTAVVGQGDAVYIPAITNTMAAFYKATGALKWQSPALPGKVVLTPALYNGVLYGVTTQASGSNYVFAINATTGALLFTPVAISAQYEAGSMDTTFVPNVFGNGQHLLVWQIDSSPGPGTPPGLIGIQISTSGANQAWTTTVPTRVGVSRVAYNQVKNALYGMHWSDFGSAVESYDPATGTTRWQARKLEMHGEFNGGFYGPHTLKADGSGFVFAGMNGDVWSVTDPGDLFGAFLPSTQVDWYYNGKDLYSESQTMGALVAGANGPVYISGTSGDAAAVKRCVYAQNAQTGQRLWEWRPVNDPAPAGAAYGWRVLSVGPDGGVYFLVREIGGQGTLYKLMPSGTLQHGACCVYNGACIPDVSEFQCVENLAGTWNGVGSTCTANLCPQPPAAESWGMKQGDMNKTGRADYAIPAERLTDNFFDSLAWQKKVPGSPVDGGLASSSMVFYDRVGPGGRDLVVGGYHWPKGVMGLDRYTGRFFWSGNPAGGESIGDYTPAFSPNGSTVYVGNDYTPDPPTPTMAFHANTGPGIWWGGADDPGSILIAYGSPTVGPAGDGRIFRYAWSAGPSAGTDSGTAISVTWSAELSAGSIYSEPVLYQYGTGDLRVITSGRSGEVQEFYGNDPYGATAWWNSTYHGGTDATPTVDPANGHIYCPVSENGNVYVMGVDRDGFQLWSELVVQVYTYEQGTNEFQNMWGTTGCLSHDGATYYFQTTTDKNTVSAGLLFAINTADGSVKWMFNTQSAGEEGWLSCPIVTPNGVIVVGNNQAATPAYNAIKDDGNHATLIDTLPVADGGNARASATLAASGLLYLPTRLAWTATSGDGETPDGSVQNLFNAFDLRSLVCRGDCNCDGRVDFGDINAFVAVLSGGTPCRVGNCDINGDGRIDFADINPFVALLSGGGGPCH